MKGAHRATSRLLVLVVPILALASSFGIGQAHSGRPHAVSFVSTTYPGFTIHAAGSRGVATLGFDTPMIIDCVSARFSGGGHTVYMRAKRPLGGKVSLILYSRPGFTLAWWGHTGRGPCNAGSTGYYFTHAGVGLVAP